MRGKEKEKRGGGQEGGGGQRERGTGKREHGEDREGEGQGWGRRGREEVNSSATRKCYSYHNSLLSATLISIQFY